MNTQLKIELAKLLKEKGFPQLNRCLYYTKDKEHCLVGWGFNDRTENSLAQYSAPTIAEVIMWLYEKHEIWIYVKLGYGHECVVQSTQSPFNFIYSDGTFNSPTEAYEAAIDYTLKNLI